jgi:hypothetical protein
MFLRSAFTSILVGLIRVATVLALMTPADAAKRRRGGKVCMTDHFHYGSSSGERKKKLARREAIASWRGFTAFEYGNAWASFRLARSKVVRCSRSDSGWGCDIEAVPCRRR